MRHIFLSRNMATSCLQKIMWERVWLFMIDSSLHTGCICGKLRFSTKINLMSSPMPHQSFGKSTYFVSKLAQIKYSLLWKDMCQFSMQLFPVMIFYISTKLSFGETNSCAEVTNVFWYQIHYDIPLRYEQTAII